MKLPFWPNPIGYRNINLGLSRVYDLLARLDNPHTKLPPTIHIAGTNGKGSTLAFLRAIFEESGYSIHAYTSPHLVEFNERIVLNGKNISDEFLNQCLQACKDAAETEPKIEITYFEGITVAAFLAFSKTKADILLLETGMGGRLDATNVITENLLSIITPISFDHTEFLGDNLEKIAFEKAGIIKPHCPVIVAKQEDCAFKVIAKKAQELGCELTSVTSFALELEQSPSLIGSHQIDNAKTAIIAALMQKKLPITLNQACLAITKAKWKARLQKIENGKYFSNNYELYLDGSHNLQGATTVLEFLKSQKEKNRIVIFAMLKDKDCASFLAKIKDEIDLLIALEIADEPKSRDGENILQIAKKLEINAILAKNFDDAFLLLSSPQLLSFLQRQQSKTLVTITGSLYLAGKFLEENEKI